MCIPGRGTRILPQGLYSCFLTVPPLSLHPLPSLISNCLNLSLGTQGRLWRLNEAHFLKTRNGEHRKSFCAQEPRKALLSYHISVSDQTFSFNPIAPENRHVLIVFNPQPVVPRMSNL